MDELRPNEKMYLKPKGHQPFVECNEEAIEYLESVIAKLRDGTYVAHPDGTAIYRQEPSPAGGDSALRLCGVVINTALVLGGPRLVTPKE